MNFYIPATTQIFEYPTYVQTAVWTKDVNEGSRMNEEVSFSSKEGLVITADISLSYQLVADRVPAFDNAGDLGGERFERLALLVGVVVAAVDASNALDGVIQAGFPDFASTGKNSAAVTKGAHKTVRNRVQQLRY